MITKTVALVSFAAGYVAGSAAGRERYEQIRTIALGVAHERGAAVAEKVTGHHAAGAPDNPTAEDVAISLHL